MDNPVYYVQYAHARICSVRAKAREAGINVPARSGDASALLDTLEDLALLKQLERFPTVVEAAARTLSPHHVSFYLRELAGLLHKYYALHKVLDTDAPERTKARLTLLAAVANVLANGLTLLGVQAPERM